MDFAGTRSAKALMRTKVVVPSRKTSELVSHVFDPVGYENAARPFMLERAHEALDERDASLLANGAETRSDAVAGAPIAKLSPELSALIGDGVRRRRARERHCAIQQVADASTVGLLRKDLEVEDLSGEVVEDDDHVPAKRSARSRCFSVGREVALLAWLAACEAFFSQSRPRDADLREPEVQRCAFCRKGAALGIAAARQACEPLDGGVLRAPRGLELVHAGILDPKLLAQQDDLGAKALALCGESNAFERAIDAPAAGESERRMCQRSGGNKGALGLPRPGFREWNGKVEGVHAGKREIANC